VRDTTPSVWETIEVAACRQQARALSRGQHWIDADDLEQLLLIAVVRACRVWSREDPERPPRGYLVRAMLNARADLYDAAKRRSAAIDDTTVVLDTYDGAPGCAVAVTTTDPGARLDAVRALTMLSERLSPQHWALLHAVAHGDSPTPPGATAGARRMAVLRARERARDVLRMRPSVRAGDTYDATDSHD
jgi:DNA-directed RNA polymerase specialized sigma24 family protein